jgi:hypothetical protein
MRQDLAMRWDALFADLEAQSAALGHAERAAEVEERTRAELGTLHVVDRARAALGATVIARLAGGALLTGRVARVGPDWLLMAQDPPGEAVVALRNLLGLRGLPRYSAVPGAAGVVESRLGLRHALRGIARDRCGVRVLLVDGSAVDGTVDRVGADFVELASHPAAEPRRRAQVRDVELVPLAALAALRRIR